MKELWFLPAALLFGAVCVFCWFRAARRVLRGRMEMVESAESQLSASRENALGAGEENEADVVLSRSESIYRQAVTLYNGSLRKLWIRLPARLMGFRPIKSVGAERDKGHERYIGSVRFFKNLILLAVVLLIAIPTFATIRLVISLKETDEELLAKESIANSLYRENEDLSRALGEKEDDGLTLSEMWELLDAESPYADLYPDFYAPQEFNATKNEEGVIYLTFDDGPSKRTGEILDILREKDVKATFFVIGSESATGKEMLKRIVEEGHTLGMHTYSHDYTRVYESVEAYLDDMYRLFTLIRDTTGTTPTVFRFPGGSINAYNSSIYQELISEMMRRGFVPFDWNLANSDAISNRLVPTEELISNAMQKTDSVRRGVMLMHDSAGKTTTVEALGPIIDNLREKGFELKPLTSDVMPVLFSYSDQKISNWEVS